MIKNIQEYQQKKNKLITIPWYMIIFSTKARELFRELEEYEIYLKIKNQSNQ